MELSNSSGSLVFLLVLLSVETRLSLDIICAAWESTLSLAAAAALSASNAGGAFPSPPGLDAPVIHNNSSPSMILLPHTPLRGPDGEPLPPRRKPILSASDRTAHRTAHSMAQLITSVSHHSTA